ncbi:MAG: hypothetical protein AAF393_14330 [Pseudomonadota bacterium]
MIYFRTLVMCLALALSAALLPQPAAASDAVCANPESSAEEALCDDPYLMGLNLQISAVLSRFVSNPADPLPEWLQVEYAHHWIAMDECDGSFRCVEAALVDYLDQINRTYLESFGSRLAPYQNTPFKLFQSQDSTGNDLMPWNNPLNFGWSQYLCQLRCAANSGCVAVGYNPLEQVDGVYGYCTMKHKVNTPLTNWADQGVLLIRQ